MSETDTAPTLIPSRYRRVRRYFLHTFLHLLWWDVFMNRPGLHALRPEPIKRWVKLARRYRHLAVELGGVMIKLGQFLSVRVDVLPAEVARELAGLRDQVPPEPFDRIRPQLEADFEGPLDEHFCEIDEEPLGAASLAQVHRARLASGEPVVIKVFRPDIHAVVETDLAAIDRAMRWLKLYRRVGRRVDLDRLSREFARITRMELDTQVEGRNAERFAADFKEDPRVYVPRVIWTHTARNTLTMEDVSYIPLDDIEAMRTAGISEKDVAATFFELFMTQVFETYFVHVDLHGGNAFIRPLPTAEEKGRPGFGPGEEAPHMEQRAFQIAFIDFGMMAEVPEAFRDIARNYVVGLGTGDAHRIVQAYVDADVLLPGADLELIEHATADILRRYSNIRMEQIREVAWSEARRFAVEYRELIYEAPFQFPVDLLFIFRAAGLLSGMTTHLDPTFSPLAAAMPFAEKLARRELGKDADSWITELANLARLLYGLPRRVDTVMNKLERGTLKVQASQAPDLRLALARIGAGIDRLGAVIVGATLFLAGTGLHLTGEEAMLGKILFALGAVIMLAGLVVRRN